jgi:hypothetical protein
MGFGSPSQPSGTEKDSQAETILAHIAMVLLHRNDHSTAELLLEVKEATLEWDPEAREDDLWLDVAPEHLGSFTDEVLEKLRATCREIAQRFGYETSWLGVREVLPGANLDWRDHVLRQTTKKRPTNQARRVRAGAPQFTEDWLFFTNDGERTVYLALKHIQEKTLPKEDTIGIYPLAGGRVPGRTWEPDVLVTYKEPFSAGGGLVVV